MKSHIVSTRDNLWRDYKHFIVSSRRCLSTNVRAKSWFCKWVKVMQFLCSTEPERRTAAHCSLDLLQRSEGHPEVTRRPRVQAVLQWAAACSVTQHVDCRHMMQLLQTARTLSWAPRCRAAVLQCRMLIVVCGQSNVLTTLHILHTFFVTSETSILMVSNNKIIWL